MEEQAHRMSRLVDDLLSLSRIELREHDAPSSQSDIVAILRSVAATLELAAARRGMRIEVVAEALPPVVGERDELTQVRSEEHTSELQSLMRHSYAVFCLKKNNKTPRQK